MVAGARIADVIPQSPADIAGFSAGCTLFRVDGEPIRDIIDWWWHADGDQMQVEGADPVGHRLCVELERDFGQDWGFVFDGVLFDEPLRCRNACTFCFMDQLPAHMRPTLTFKDDDYRLSFLQGNFVTFTNLDDTHVARIIEQHISPLRYSLHAVSPAVRQKLMGKHAQQGLDRACELLAGGIELHAQIVLVPGENDGDELRRTLQWALGQPGIANVGIVPLGSTSHQMRFDRSFDAPDEAQEVLGIIDEYSARAMEQRGYAWVYAADEFYCNASPDSLLEMLPPASHYASFDMFEDGIGMVRAFVDDFAASKALLERTHDVLEASRLQVLFVCGCAQKAFFAPLLAQSPCASSIKPLYVPNRFLGGNVNVTGLVCGADIVRELRDITDDARENTLVVAPKVMFNSAGVTLDDMGVDDLSAEGGMTVHVVSCQPSDFLSEIVSLVSQREVQS